MEERKDIISQNLVKYRIANGLTQLELAEKLNYSDKAISKWERGEAFPDIMIFIEIAKLYKITVNDLLERTPRKRNWYRTNEKVLIPLISFFTVWVVAITLWIIVGMNTEWKSYWLILIYAIPISILVLMIFNYIWGRRIFSIILTSIFLWTGLLAIFLAFQIEPLLFLIGIPGQAIVMMAYMVSKNKSKGVKKLK